MELTELAAAEIIRLCAQSTKEGDLGLRISVTRGGCAGFQYIMEITTSNDGDITLTQFGAKIHLAPDSQPYLSESQLDFVDTLSDSGFRIFNKNAARTCGCGTSFEPLSQEVTASP